MLRCVQWSHAIELVELSDGLNQFGLIDDNCYKMADTIEPLMISTANKWIRKAREKKRKWSKFPGFFTERKWSDNQCQQPNTEGKGKPDTNTNI